MVGKAARSGKSKAKTQRHQPLDEQIADEKVPRAQQRVKQKKKDKKEEDDEGIAVLDKKLSQKILAQARDQLEEDEEEDRDVSKPRRASSLFNKQLQEEDDDDEEDEEELDEENYDEEHFEDLEITEEDERLLQTFMKPAGTVSNSLTLADVILEKIRQKEQQDRMDGAPLEERLASTFDPKIAEVYRGVGALLSRYSSGKIPKAFKILPSLNNWEELLFLTNPQGWSPHAMMQATKIFSSSLNSRMAQRFYNLILLPRVMDNITTYKKLNFHLYLALKKAVYKPAAFFKGILLPLCETGDCSFRQAAILGSILTKVSIPALHTSAAIMKIAQMPYLGLNSLFLRLLLNKKYALPYKCVDAVVDHFARFKNDTRRMHLLWYQCFLVFVQRYKNDLLAEQKEVLKSVSRNHLHDFFHDEIQRELNSSKSRGSEVKQEAEFKMDWV